MVLGSFVLGLGFGAWVVLLLQRRLARDILGGKNECN